MNPSSSEDRLHLARNGDPDALGELLEEFRDMLRGKAREELNSKLQVRVDPSDVVQATFLEAHRDVRDFQGNEIGQFAAWLQQILRHNILQSVEQHKLAQKRSIQRETPLNDSHGQGGELQDALQADQSTPSQRAEREELSERLQKAIDALPLDQQTATRLRFLEGQSLEQIAAHLDRSKTAIAGLLKRGMRKLRQEFAVELGEESP